MVEQAPLPPPDPTKKPIETPESMIKGGKEPAPEAFRQFLGPEATQEHFKMFMNTWLKHMMHDIKKHQEKWKESMEKMKRGEY